MCKGRQWGLLGCWRGAVADRKGPSNLAADGALVYLPLSDCHYVVSAMHNNLLGGNCGANGLRRNDMRTGWCALRTGCISLSASMPQRNLNTCSVMDGAHALLDARSPYKACQCAVLSNLCNTYVHARGAGLDKRGETITLRNILCYYANRM